MVKAPRVIVGLLALALFMTSAQVARATEISTLTTPGGLAAWYVQEKTIPILTVAMSFKGGAALDPEGREGLANMVSGLLDEGAGEMSSLEFQKRLDELAISISFSAGKDRFSVNLRTLTKNREEAFRLLGLALGAPRFEKDAVERVRSQILTNLESELEAADSVAAKAWFRKIFPNHVYGRPSRGTKNSVAAVTTDDLRGFVTRRIARDNVLIGAVGDVDGAEIGRLLDLAFGGLPEKSVPVKVAEVTPVETGSVTVIRKPNPQSVVMFGMPGVKRKDPDYYPAYVMNYILGGGGFTSRLYQEVREKRGLAYSVYSYLYPYDHAGVYLGGVATANARVAESLDVVRAEISRLAAEGISEDELRRAKTFLNGSFPLRLDSNAKIARILTGIQISDLGVDYIEKRPGYINAVTIEDIRRVARRLLRPEAMTFVIVGDPEGIDG